MPRSSIFSQVFVSQDHDPSIRDNHDINIVNLAGNTVLPCDHCCIIGTGLVPVDASRSSVAGSSGDVDADNRATDELCLR
jgi:hypothetical protein